MNNPIGNTILNAAERVLRQRGIDRASLDDVARELDVSRTVLGYVVHKTDLWEHIVGRKLTEITARLSPNSEALDGSTAEANLSSAMDALVRASRIFQREDPTLFAAYRTLSQEQAQVITSFQRALITKIEAIIVRGIQLHEFSAYDPWQASWATLNAIAPFYDPRFDRDWSAPGNTMLTDTGEP